MKTKLISARTYRIRPLLTATLALALAFTFSCSGGDDDNDGGNNGNGSSLAGTSGTFTDGDKTYKWVKIGEQFWMAENLNNDTKGKCYDELQTNCEKYGRLYDWATAMALDPNCNSKSCASQIGTKHKGICPEGWHIPSKAEWEAREDYVSTEKSCTNCTGTYLKSTNGWTDYMGNPSGNGIDGFGFSALPGGIGDVTYDYFSGVGNEGRWWGACEYNKNSNEACADIMYYGLERSEWKYDSKSRLFSVRCVKD